MLRPKHRIPLDYSLCTMTVTVYRREGLTREVLEGVHFEFTDELQTENGRSTENRSFLLVIPGICGIAPGDKVALGVGPADITWEALTPAAVPTLGVVKTVKPRFFRGVPCHVEARG